MQNHCFLDRALQLAQIRRGFCAPNPAVGAVIVSDNNIIAEGYHWQAGHPHAEIVALKQANISVKNASLYVTLEPCAHWGKTPPCVDAIISSGISAVYYGFRDPNPKVAGLGQQLLRQAKIVCEQISVAAIDKFYRSYAFWWQHQRPWITAKLALSLDGKFAGSQGEPITITGEELQHHTHRRRKHSDAILTTAKTILSDDPQLNVRLDNQVIAKPIYILDSKLSIATTARVFTTANKIIIFHATGNDHRKINQLAAMGAKCVEVGSDAQGLDLRQVIDHIGADGVQDLWIEAGSKSIQALIKLGLVQQLLVYVGNKVIGQNAMPAFDLEEVCEAVMSKQQYCIGDEMVFEFNYM